MSELFAIIHRETDGRETVVAPGPKPWDALDLSRRIGLLGHSVALPAQPLLWTAADGSVRLVRASVTDDVPPRTHYPMGYVDTIEQDSMARVYQLGERDLDEVRHDLVKADKLTARDKINALDLAWMIEREALEGIPVPQAVKDARQAIVDAQRAREEWLLTATRDELADAALTGIPSWEPIPVATPAAPVASSEEPVVSEEPTAAEPEAPSEAPAEPTPTTDPSETPVIDVDSQPAA